MRVWNKVLHENKKKAGVTILVSNKINFKTKTNQEYFKPWLFDFNVITFPLEIATNLVQDI